MWPIRQTLGESVCAHSGPCSDTQKTDDPGGPQGALVRLEVSPLLSWRRGSPREQVGWAGCRTTPSRDGWCCAQVLRQVVVF